MLLLHDVRSMLAAHTNSGKTDSGTQSRVCSYVWQPTTCILMLTKFLLAQLHKEPIILAALHRSWCRGFNHRFVYGTAFRPPLLVSINITSELWDSSTTAKTAKFSFLQRQNRGWPKHRDCILRAKCCGYQNRTLDWQEPTLAKVRQRLLGIYQGCCGYINSLVISRH